MEETNRAKELRLKRTEINKLNRQRARAMEQSVARKFTHHGFTSNRTPYSGAGHLKGDGIGYSSQGMFIYDCKMSAAKTPAGHKTIDINYYWLAKLTRETENMKARFSFFVIHYHGSHDMYVFMRQHYWNTIFQISITDLPKIESHRKVTIALREPELEEKCKQYGIASFEDVKTNDLYGIMKLRDFIEMMKQDETRNTED